MNIKPSTFLGVSAISFVIATILIFYGWSDKVKSEERPVDFQLADELCKYYGHQEAINIISDGQKIKMMCK